MLAPMGHSPGVMSAIETCRTAALGGHVERCEDCAHERIAYNSCRNRHCPKGQAAAARQWLEDREAELLPVPYYHVVFTLPSALGAFAFHNKAAVYDLLFRTAAETMIAIAADPKHLGARIGLTAVLHTWGFAADPSSPCPRHRSRRRPRAGRVALDRLQARLLPARARAVAPLPPALPRRARVAEGGRPPRLPRRTRVPRRQERLRRCACPVAPRRVGGHPKGRSPGPVVLAYLARYTHRVAISNARLIALDDQVVTFKWKDYRVEGRDRLKTLTLAAARVHPPLSPARAAERLPSHPTLRPLRRRGASRQHRARPTIAGRARERPARAEADSDAEDASPCAAAHAAAAG